MKQEQKPPKRLWSRRRGSHLWSTVLTRPQCTLRRIQVTHQHLAPSCLHPWRNGSHNAMLTCHVTCLQTLMFLYPLNLVKFHFNESRAFNDFSLLLSFFSFLQNLVFNKWKTLHCKVLLRAECFFFNWMKLPEDCCIRFIKKKNRSNSVSRLGSHAHVSSIWICKYFKVKINPKSEAILVPIIFN